MLLSYIRRYWGADELYKLLLKGGKEADYLWLTKDCHAYCSRK